MYGGHGAAGGTGAGEGGGVRVWQWRGEGGVDFMKGWKDVFVLDGTHDAKLAVRW